MLFLLAEELKIGKLKVNGILWTKTNLMNW